MYCEKQNQNMSPFNLATPGPSWWPLPPAQVCILALNAASLGHQHSQQRSPLLSPGVQFFPALPCRPPAPLGGRSHRLGLTGSCLGKAVAHRTSSRPQEGEGPRGVRSSAVPSQPPRSPSVTSSERGGGFLPRAVKHHDSLLPLPPRLNLGLHQAGVPKDRKGHHTERSQTLTASPGPAHLSWGWTRPSPASLSSLLVTSQWGADAHLPSWGVIQVARTPRTPHSAGNRRCL